MHLLRNEELKLWTNIVKGHLSVDFNDKESWKSIGKLQDDLTSTLRDRDGFAFGTWEQLYELVDKRRKTPIIDALEKDNKEWPNFRYSVEWGNRYLPFLLGLSKTYKKPFSPMLVSSEWVKLTDEEQKLWNFIRENLLYSDETGPDVWRPIGEAQIKLTQSLFGRNVIPQSKIDAVNEPINGRTKKTWVQQFDENYRRDPDEVGSPIMYHPHWGYYYLPYFLGYQDDFKIYKGGLDYFKCFGWPDSKQLQYK